jgi:Ca2+/Na+ antiporter
MVAEYDDAFAGEEEGRGAPPLWLWIALIAIAAASFWVQATVTEERFVPALNVASRAFRIPDDVAGATLMAAGASSPELFSSFVALFVTRSALGLGTIVGSEIFNQLVICAGAVFASKSNFLKLDPAVVSREVGFYALSVVLLYAALRDTRPDPDDDSGVDHIYISFGDSLVVFSGYVAYVLVCANMEAVVTFVTSCWRTITGTDSRRADLKANAYTIASGGGRNGRSSSEDYGSFPQQQQHQLGTPRVSHRKLEQPEAKMPFLREKSLMKTEPGVNFEEASFYRQRSSIIETNDPEGSLRSLGSLKSQATAPSRTRSSRKLEYWLQREKPSDEYGLHDVELNSFGETLCCFLWQRSHFYDKARVAVHGWHLRWFRFSRESLQSVPNRSHADEHCMTYPPFREVEVDESRLIVRIVNPDPTKRDYYLMAPSKTILDMVISKMEVLMAYHDTLVGSSTLLFETEGDAIGSSTDDHVSLLEAPTGRVAWVFFIFLLPIRILMHLTIPDVRVLDRHGDPVGSLWKAGLAIASCLLWLIVGSYAMVASLEKLADLLDIPEAVIGVTVSAAGTSLPNYVASRIAAQNGFGVSERRIACCC